LQYASLINKGHYTAQQEEGEWLGRICDWTSAEDRHARHNLFLAQAHHGARLSTVTRNLLDLDGHDALPKRILPE
jgi:hypothetical protein